MSVAMSITTKELLQNPDRRSGKGKSIEEDGIFQRTFAGRFTFNREQQIVSSSSQAPSQLKKNVISTLVHSYTFNSPSLIHRRYKTAQLLQSRAFLCETEVLLMEKFVLWHTWYNCLTVSAVPICFTDAISITDYFSGNCAQCFIHILCEAKNAEVGGKLCCVLTRAVNCTLCCIENTFTLALLVGCRFLTGTCPTLFFPPDFSDLYNG